MELFFLPPYCDDTVDWVNWVVNQLHRAEGIQSTSHPESIRDQVSKSGRTKPPAGWYNFDERSGKRLMEIKNKQSLFLTRLSQSPSPSRQAPNPKREILKKRKCFFVTLKTNLVSFQSCIFVVNHILLAF